MEENGWIKISESLPKQGEGVMICSYEEKNNPDNYLQICHNFIFHEESKSEKSHFVNYLNHDEYVFDGNHYYLEYDTPISGCRQEYRITHWRKEILPPDFEN